MFIPSVMGPAPALELYGFPEGRYDPIVRNEPGLYVHVTLKLSNGDVETWFVQEVAGKWEPNGCAALLMGRRR